MAQVNPEVLDRINFDDAAGKLALWRGVPASVVHSDDEVAAIRQSREQQQAAAAMAGAAEPISKAVLNLAKANEAGGQI